jgi:hypothetical protein
LDTALGFGPKLRRTLGWLTACAFVWSGLWPGWAGAPAALAGDGATIAVVPLAPVLEGTSQKIADRVSAMLGSELSKSDSLRLVSLAGHSSSSNSGGSRQPQLNDDADDSEGGVTDVTVGPSNGGANGGNGGGSGGSVPIFQGAGDRALARGKATIGRAEKEMRRLRFDQAAQDFQDGISAVESCFDSLESFQLLTDAYLGLAIADLRVGHRDEGERALEAVVRLAPDMSLARSHFPAIFVRMFNQAHSRLIGSQGSLSVASVVPGQSISLDGRDAGVTPANLKVLPGRHFVVIHSASGQVAYRVDVPAGGEAQVGGGASRHVAVASPQRSPARAMPSAPSTPGASSEDLHTVRDEIRANLIDGPGDVALRNIARASGAQFLLLGGLHVLNDAGDLALDLFVYALGPDQLAPLKRYRFDGELLGAQIEVYKVVQALAVKTNAQSFADALTLPTPIAADYNPGHKGAGAPLALSNQQQATEKPPPSDTGSSSSSDDDEDQIKLQTGQPKPKGEGEARADKGSSRTLTAESTENQALATPGVEDTGEKKGGGLGTWTIVGISVLAVVAVGVATYFIVDAATVKPSSWNAGISF